MPASSASADTSAHRLREIRSFYDRWTPTLVETAGTTLQFAVRSGISSSATLQFPPTVRVSGSYPQWTLTFDDGYGGAGEPDFNDLVILIIATP